MTSFATATAGGVAALAALALVACAAPEERSADPARVDGGDPAEGRSAVMQYGCGSCHQVPGVDSVEDGVGPDLGGLSERRYVAGRLPNRPDNLVRWIHDPQGVAPGTLMPDLDVTEDDARDIAAYLYSR